mmetsp:Transcript_38003/g.64674  ORF Transcript_38003/g.64674 Transcript_38003/m.64674 type:complete len:224 (-) Transcript_38003:542-1213(-)
MLDAQTALNTILTASEGQQGSEDGDAAAAKAEAAVATLTAAVKDEAAVGDISTQVASACGGTTVLFGSQFCNALSQQKQVEDSTSATAAAAAGMVVPAPVRKSLSLVGVAEVPPGQDLLKPCVTAMAAQGFSGALLSAACAPGHLSLVDSGKYWAAAFAMLRSKQSQTFEVRLRAFTKEGAGAPDAWNEYMKMTYDSGLAATDDIPSAEEKALDAGRGDALGF